MKIILGLVFTLMSAGASADRLCGEATFNCVNPINGEIIVLNQKPTRFCTKNGQLSREELLLKLSFYQVCSSFGGVVQITDMNK